MSQGEQKPEGEGSASSDQRGSPSRHESLSDLGARLDAVRQRERAEPEKPSAATEQHKGMAIAWRLSIELLAGPLVGGFLGWQIDKWLGTKPWMFVVLLLLGAAAGMNLMIKAAKSMNKEP